MYNIENAISTFNFYQNLKYRGNMFLDEFNFILSAVNS
jgi:hypothetical protein